MGDKCEVERLIEEYLQKEKQERNINILEAKTEAELDAFCKQDASEFFNQITDIQEERFRERCEKYDIITHEDLMYYESGDSIEPNLLSALKKSFVFYDSLTKEKFYKTLMGQPAEIRCKWLVENNTSILIRDCDWNKIFTDIEENENSFSRYYPVMRVKLEHDNLIYMAIAIVLNDELYAYCKNSV